jgi:lipooligosaccharide transport system ATP-binding protein
MGVVTQHDGLDTGLTVFQNLFLYGFLVGLSKVGAQKRTHEVLEFFNLRDRSRASVYELSGGMKRRLAIARSMMCSPTVIVLDEPSTGLDPQSRNRVWEELAILKESGVTVLLSTHYMEEAAILCDRLSIMDQGKILDEGTPDQMIRRHAPKEVAQLRVAPASLRLVRDYLDKRKITFREVGALISVTGTEGDRPDLSDLDHVDGVRTSYRLGNLEDVFLTLTGRELRDG